MTLFIPKSASADDHFLTLGGGYSPAGNQISLERNVLFFKQVLADLYPKANPPAHDIFFSDGDSPGRDVQYEDPAYKIPEVNQLLARLYSEEDDLGYRYRTHQIPGVRGAATRTLVDKWFIENGPAFKPSDRLIVYVTGHGGHDDTNTADPYANNYLNLWNGDTLDVRQLAAKFDALPEGITVVVVMVQCYAGGFADLLFTGGQSENGLANQTRCGFFATTPDRPAAGCTAEVNEANYEDYSSSFWAALLEKTRTGKTVERKICDYDHNGVVTFAEAHAHVLLTDQSIDIPMTTSDRFLRLKSDPGASRGRLVSAEDMLARLESLATPAERAVIDGLSKQLQLDGQYRYANARDLGQSLHAQHDAGEEKQKTLTRQYTDASTAITDALEIRWPELHNRWDPAAEKLLHDEGNAIVAAIKADSHFAEFNRLGEELDRLDEKDDALETKWAKCQRLLHTIERVALIHNLEKVADDETRARFKQLIAAENGTIGAKR